MEKVTERDILLFAVAFVKKVCRIDYSLIYYGRNDYYICWDNKKLMLYDIYKNIYKKINI